MLNSGASLQAKNRRSDKRTPRYSKDVLEGSIHNKTRVGTASMEASNQSEMAMLAAKAVLIVTLN